MCQALLEIMGPEISKIAEQSAVQEAMETAANMLSSGEFSIEQVKKYIPRLSLEEITMIAERLADNCGD